MTLDLLGEPITRPKGQGPPCFACPKVSEEAKRAASLARRRPTPADADSDLTPRNQQVLDHYRRCRAVGWNVPDAADPLVQRHAAIIADMERQQDKLDAARQVLAGIVRGAGHGGA